MITSFIVFLIVLFACTLGAISGLGGGIIIKPLMDALGGFSAATVNDMASITILTMTIVSIIKARKNAGQRRPPGGAPADLHEEKQTQNV